MSRHASARPLLSLGVGVISIPLLPPLPPLSHDETAPPVVDAAPQPGGAATSPVQQLAAALAQADPGWAARLAATGEHADIAFLERWLHARGSVDSAAASIMAHVAWRTTLVGTDGGPADSSPTAGTASAGAAPALAAGGALPPLGRGISEASIAEELAARKVFLQGLDAAGCPVVVVQASRCGWVVAGWHCIALGQPVSGVWCTEYVLSLSPALRLWPRALTPLPAPGAAAAQARHGAPQPDPDQAPDCLRAGQVQGCIGVALTGSWPGFAWHSVGFKPGAA